MSTYCLACGDSETSQTRNLSTYQVLKSYLQVLKIGFNEFKWQTVKRILSNLRKYTAIRHHFFHRKTSSHVKEIRTIPIRSFQNWTDSTIVVLKNFFLLLFYFSMTFLAAIGFFNDNNLSEIYDNEFKILTTKRKPILYYTDCKLFTN